MLEAVGMKEIDAIFVVTDGLGIHREMLVIPLGPATPGRVRRLPSGKLEITVEADPSARRVAEGAARAARCRPEADCGPESEARARPRAARGHRLLQRQRWALWRRGRGVVLRTGAGAAPSRAHALSLEPAGVARDGRAGRGDAGRGRLRHLGPSRVRAVLGLSGRLVVVAGQLRGRRRLSRAVRRVPEVLVSGDGARASGGSWPCCSSSS